VRPERLALGRRKASPFPRQSTQRLATTDHAHRIVERCRRLAAPAKNPPTGQTPDADNQDPESFTKDVSLSKAEIEKLIQEIENATDPRKMISLETARAAGAK
jgi:hypothetical protein